MTLIERLSLLIVAIKTETKALRTLISGTNNGNVSGLTTSATNLVAAINEVKQTADTAVSAGGAVIDDNSASLLSTFSSSKINSDIAAAKTAVKNEILGGAAAEVDTLMEIAALLDANTGTDAALALIVANKANSSDVYTQAQIGDPDTNFVTQWNAA